MNIYHVTFLQRLKHLLSRHRTLEHDGVMDTTMVDMDGECVDLGLPSGTLWATCNVGANKPEDYGGYFGWHGGKTATANWGNGWNVPSKEQWEELLQNTNSIWTTRNGVNGRLFTASNGKGLFLPAAGERWNDELCDAGSGRYWSSSLYDTGRTTFAPRHSSYFYFESGRYGMYFSDHIHKLSVRAVREN